MLFNKYLMESEVEAIRLEKKTNRKAVEQQAIWAGLKKGMSVADLGCGPGVTTDILHEITSSTGKTVGIDFSEERIAKASASYRKKNLTTTIIAYKINESYRKAFETSEHYQMYSGKDFKRFRHN